MLFVKKPPKDTDAAPAPVQDSTASGAVLDGEAVRVPDSPSEKSAFSFMRGKQGAKKPAERIEPTVAPAPRDKPAKAAAEIPGQATVVESPSTKANKLLGKFGKPAGVSRKDEAKPEKSAKADHKAEKLKQPPKPKAPKRGARPLYVGMDVNETATEWWEVSGDRLIALEAPPRNGRAVLFSKKDMRLAASKALSYREAVGLGFEESGEDVTVVNASAKHRVVYATSPDRIQALGLEIVPGLLVLEAAAARAKAELPAIVGFNLPGEGGKVAALVLGVVQAKGGLARSQMTLNTDNPQFSINQFVAQQKGLPESRQVQMFGLEELLLEAASLQAYPTEPLIAGRIPKSRAMLMAVALSAAMMAGSISYYGYLQTLQAGVRSQIEQAQRDDKAEKRKLAELVEARVLALTAVSSLNPANLFSAATALWVPSSTVALDASVTSGAQLTVTFSPGGMRKNKSSSFTASAEDIQAFSARETVGTCTRTKLSVNGVTNEIVATYLCESAAAAVPGYSLD